MRFFEHAVGRRLSYTWAVASCLMELVSQNSRRVMAASICLFAAICMYAPMGLAAWPAGGTCCHGNSCAIPEHHHRQAPAYAGHGAPCAHDMGGLAACSMSCCYEVEHLSVASTVYVTPALFTIPEPLSRAQRIAVRSADEFLQSLKPLSPPPRA